VQLSGPSSEIGLGEGVDLVLDASGRNSKLDKWLSEAGHPAVEKSEIAMDLMYRTCMFRPPADQSFDWSFLVIYPKTPEERRAGYIFRVEDDLWLATMLGYMGVKPPTDVDGLRAFARELPKPDIYEALRDAEPISDVWSYRFTPAFWKHYERQPLPPGLLAIGDSVCSFNPVFGQGMAVALLEAKALHELLSQGGELTSEAWFRAIKPIISDAWMPAQVEDYRFPEIKGKRTLAISALQWFNKQLFIVSGYDADVNTRFLQASHMVARPTVLFAPSVVLKICKQWILGPPTSEA